MPYEFEKEIINTILTRANSYIEYCQKGQLIRGIQKSFSKPKITSLITVFNSEKYIRQAICSIQNQNMVDIEILIIDDNSGDNSFSIIEEIKKTDKRIKVIRNKKNRGALYSKSLGIIKAQGKYTMILDSDDLFINEELFVLCFNESIQNNIDIIEFSGFWSYLSKFNLNGRLFKTTLKIIGKQVYNKKINYGDDRLINFILFKTSKSFKFIKQFGYIYNYNNVSITHSNKTFNNCHDELINIDHIYKYTKFSNDSEIVVFEIFHRYERIIKPGLNKENWKYLQNLIMTLLSNKYISDFNKKKLLNLTNNIKMA